MQVLLDAGAAVNARDERGYTPLFWVAWPDEPGSAPAIRFLVEHGANVKVKARNGTTLWQWFRKDRAAVKALNDAVAGK